MTVEEDKKEQDPLKDDSDTTSCGKVNKDLVVPKLSFFFFYMGMGAFLPYLGVYYKQLWLNARESGILLGIRPFIKMMCSPIWGIVTDYFHKPKLILLLSLAATMVGHWSQSIVSPFVLPCYEENKTIHSAPSVTGPDIAARSFIQHPGDNLTQRSKRYYLLDKKIVQNQDFDDFPELENKNQEREKEEYGILDFPIPQRYLSKWPESKEKPGKTSPGLQFARTIMIKNKKVKSPKPVEDFRIRDNDKIYLTLLILIIFGEMVAAPAPMLADSGTLALLPGREHEYGRQRLFGSFGWGFGSLLSGAVVTAFHSCPYSDNINYVPVFYVFAVAMLMAFIVACFFKFTKAHDDHVESRAKKCMEGLNLFKNVKNAAFIFVLFFFGFLHSLKLSFLFWFLQDIGGTPILFTLIVLVSSLSEVVVFYIATYIVKKLGHDAVLYIGLWVYAIKYLLYSFIQHPWYVLPIESLQGITYGLVWTASVSYISSGPGFAVTIQGIIHGVYWGLGFAVGGVLGGYLVHIIGARATFRIMACLCVAILFAFFALNSIYDRTHSGYMEVSSLDKDAKDDGKK